MPELPRQDENTVLNSGPPNEWFFGYGYKNRGILKVGMSPLFRSLFGDVVATGYQQWRHLSKPSGIPTEKAAEARTLEAIVLKATGFTPEQIAGKSDSLTLLFRNKINAPFGFDLE